MTARKRRSGIQETIHALPEYYVAIEANPSDFTVIGASAALLEHFGLDETVTIGHSLTDVFYQGASREWVSDLRASVIRTIEAKTQQTTEATKLPSVNKKKQSWRVTNLPVIGPAGELQYIIQSLHDESGEVAVSVDEHDDIASLFTMANAVPLLTWIAYGDGKPMYYNALWREYANIPEDNLTHFDWSTVIHPDDFDGTTEKWKQALKTGTEFEAEMRLLNLSTKIYHWFAGRARPIRGIDGDIVRWFGTCADIDEQKRAALVSAFISKATKELGSSLDYSKTLETVTRLSVPEIADWCSVDIYNGSTGEWEQVALAHVDSSKLEMARTYRKTHPIKPDGEYGVPAVVRSGKPEFHPYISDDALEMMVEAPEDLTFAKELNIRAAIIVPIFIKNTASGAITFVSSDSGREYTLSDLQMAEKLAGRISMSVTNATVYKEAKEELERRHVLEKELLVERSNLEARVKARTQQLEDANKGLQTEIERRRDAELELKRSNQELEEFAYVASHDLQEPLRKIQAFGDILEGEYGERLDDGAEYLKRMQAAASRMSHLIEDLLAFSRVSTRPPVPSKVDLNKVAFEVLGDLEDQITRTKGQVDVGTLPTVLADPTHMRQLLQNLISNGLKFHREDIAPIVAVTSRPCEGSEGMYEIYITDNGIGFDEKYIDRIFGVFQRLHGRDTYDGTGIGLAVCRKIVERYGGTITAESQKGKGAKFIIKIPVATKEMKSDK